MQIEQFAWLKYSLIKVFSSKIQPLTFSKSREVFIHILQITILSKPHKSLNIIPNLETAVVTLFYINHIIYI